MRDDGDGRGRVCECLSGTCVVEFYSTPFVFLTDTFTGKVLCAREVGGRFNFLATRYRFERILEYKLKQPTEITGFNFLVIQIIYKVYYGNYLKIF